jgi:hypothetical protein
LSSSCTTLAIDPHRALVRAQLAADQLEDGALAGAADAEDANHLAARHGKLHALEHLIAAIGKVQVFDLDEILGFAAHWSTLVAPDMEFHILAGEGDRLRHA